MTCKRRQVCNVCDAPFKMERGCFLEKRCPACRFLKLQKPEDNPFYSLRLRTLVKSNASAVGLVFYPQEPSLKTIFEGIALKGEYNDLEDRVIVEEMVAQYIDRGSISLTSRELYALEDVVMFNNELGYTAKALKVTSERVRQIVSSALKKMRHPRVVGELRQLY